MADASRPQGHNDTNWGIAMTDRRPTCPPPADVVTVFREKLAPTGATAGLGDEGPSLSPRFAVYGPGLARLPRKIHRAWHRRWRRSLAGLALSCTLGPIPAALAAQIDVGVGGCTLVDAITAANEDESTGDCPSGSGPDTITLPAASTQILTSIDNGTFGPTGLPVVVSTIVIDGNGSTIARDPSAPAFRILAVGPTGELTLQETTVTRGRIPASAAANRKGGAIASYGALTLVDSTIAGNSASRDGGGLHNSGNLTVTRSTISDNSAADDGGGIRNDGAATLINSTVSGNSGTDRGGGIRNSGSLSLTDSTISGNSAQSSGGGVFNKGTLILARSIVSGNLAPTTGPEVRNRLVGGGTDGVVISDGFNLFGHDGSARIAGFSPGVTDIVPSISLTAILDPTLADNGAPTKTHALVTGSLAIDAIPAASCGTTSDQHGVARPQDGDGDTLADCDIGAFELQLPPPPPPPPQPQPPVVVEAKPVGQAPKVRCGRSACKVRITCDALQGSGTSCSSPVTVSVRAGALRLEDELAVNVSRRIRFASGVANLQPGQMMDVQLRLTRRGRQIVRASARRTLRGTLEIQNALGTFRAGINITLRR
jgi:hypothetical protein